MAQSGQKVAQSGGEVVIDDVIEQITDRQRLILNLLGKGVIDNVIESSTSLAQKTGVSPRTIMGDLDDLRKKGLIRHVGADKGGHWEIIEKNIGESVGNYN